MAAERIEPQIDEQAEDLNRLLVDYLILADGAQVVGGKLYVLGGGWDRVQFPEYPQTLPVGLAFGIRVPWRETNRRHQFALRGMTTDGRELFKAEGEFEVGRPPGTPAGMPQRFQAAMRIPLHVPGPGQYTIEVEIDGHKRYELQYFAVQIPG